MLLAAPAPAQPGTDRPEALRVLVVQAEGKLLPRGLLLAARSPLASFPRLLARVRPTPTVQCRRVRFGRVLVPLPPGLPAALAPAGEEGLPGWEGPFFAGGRATLRLRPTGLLQVVVKGPGQGGEPTQVRLDRPGPWGTGLAEGREQCGVTGRPLSFPHRCRGQVRVTAAARGLAPVTRVVKLTGESPQRVELTLVPGAILRVGVEPPPPAGTRVSLDGQVLPWVAPDDRGTFTLAEVPREGRNHRIALEMPGRPPAFFWWRPGPGREAESHTLALPPTLCLRARLESAPGVAAAGARVVATGRMESTLRQEEWALEGRADGQGRLALTLPRTGRRAVLLFLGPAGPRGMLLTPHLAQDREELDLGRRQIREGADLRGRLTGLSPAEAARARVELTLPLECPFRLDTLERLVPVDQEGRFTFLGAGQGDYRLQARVPGRVGLSHRLRLERADREVELALPRGVIAGGRVRLPDGGPAAGARVRIEPLDERWLPLQVTTGPDGTFRAAGVPRAACRISVRLERGGRLYSARRPFDGARPEAMEIELFKEP